MDEATSSVDTKTEVQIQKAMSHLMREEPVLSIVIGIVGIKMLDFKSALVGIVGIRY